MIIRFPKGGTTEGFLLTRRDNSMRVALEGSDDAMEFIEVHGKWVSENLETVDIVFEWERQPRVEPVTEADCICPKELAGHLMQLLHTDSDAERRHLRVFTAGG